MTFTITQQPNSANLYLYPNGSSATDLTAFGETENYECVDEIWHSPNDDTDYVYSSASSTVSDWYDLPNHTTESGTINYVRVFGNALSYRGLTSGASYNFIVNDGSTIDVGKNNAPLATSYLSYNETWATKPSGGAWTWSDIDSMKIGISQLSPVLSTGGAGRTLTIEPDGNGTIDTEWSVPSASDYWVAVTTDKEIKLDTGAGDVYKYCGFTCSSPTYSFGNINSVTVRVHVADKVNGTGFGFFIFTKPSDTRYFSGQKDVGVVDTYSWQTNTWNTNPDTSAAWTWEEIEALNVGIRAYRNTSKNLYCNDIDIVVNYDSNISPTIRTTQCYAVVNYEPPASTVTLNTPMTLSASHSRKIGRVTFPDGSYEVDDYGRAGKSLKITGHETSSATANMQKLKDMCHYGEKVTIAGLPDSNHNTDYMIRNFSYKQAGGMVDRYIWSLDLEED